MYMYLYLCVCVCVDNNVGTVVIFFIILKNTDLPQRGCVICISLCNQEF